MGKWGLPAVLGSGLLFGQLADAQVALSGQQIRVGGAPVSTAAHRYVGPDYVDPSYLSTGAKAAEPTPGVPLDSRLLVVERAASLLGAFAAADPILQTTTCVGEHAVGAALCDLKWRRTHGLLAIRAQIDDTSQRLSERLFGRRVARFVSLTPDPKKLLEVRFRFR